MNILRKNRRVSGPELMTGTWSVARNEYNLDYDFSMMTAIGVDPYSYYSRLRSILYTTDLRDIPGPDEVFWFDFAIGTMGGMAFSVIALLVYFPIFCVRFRRSVGRKRRVLY